jgi:hypothetical protein
MGFDRCGDEKGKKMLSGFFIACIIFHDLWDLITIGI